MAVIMPTVLDHPDYAYTAAVDGVAYRWRFRWLTRPAAWYLTIATDRGVPIRTNLCLRPRGLALYRLQTALRPPGALLLAGPDEAPTQASLGRTHFLYYLTRADQAALAPPPAALIVPASVVTL